MENLLWLSDVFFPAFIISGALAGIVGLLTTIFWIWMLIDCLTNRAITGTEKIVWVLVVIFLHFIGALIYFLVARGRRGRVL